MKHPQAKVSRRTFLLAASAGTAATAAVLAGKKASQSAPAQDKGSESKTGYQLTEHVRNYYRTAKI
jgi:hypothetical protein